MKTSADIYQSMKTTTLQIMIETLGLPAHTAVDLVQGAESNAYLCIREQDDSERLEMPWVNGDYSDLAEKFVGSIYGGVEYHFGHLENWQEIYQCIEGSAETVLKVLTPPKKWPRFTVIVPADIAQPTYHDCHDGGGYSFDESKVIEALDALGLKEEPLFNLSGVEGDYDTICGYDNLLQVRFKRLDHSEAFINQLGLS
jgi:hypothetical protein